MYISVDYLMLIYILAITAYVGRVLYVECKQTRRIENEITIETENEFNTEKESRKKCTSYD